MTQLRAAKAGPPRTPRRRRGRSVVIVGTTQSAAQLRAALSQGDTGLRLAAVLLPAELDRLGSTLAEHDADQVLICLPLAMSATVRSLIQQLQKQAVTWRFLPTLADQLSGRVRVGLGAFDSGDAGVSAADLAMPPFVIDPVQLLDRRPAPLDEPAVSQFIRGRTVLITGAGGSIGSEIARQVGRFAPGQLILVERAENALFEIDRQIAELYHSQPRLARLHDVTDAAGTDRLIAELKPHVLFHAAAHKHVPMMENHPAAAVENNFFGTRAVADAATRHAVDALVMISTDKAVNPRSIMGATKRLAELYIESLGHTCTTRMGIVRFGNVLGSNASVLPIWSQQLLKGGPITVTHPDMTRYFMTIPEAAGLVMQAGAIAQAPASHNASVFLLDMGQPIRIVDLAQRFVRSQGFEPGVDVKIEYTGVRPGEKLFEELVYLGENLAPTSHRSIRVWRTAPADPGTIQEVIAAFDELRRDEGWTQTPRAVIARTLRRAIPEMSAEAV